MLVKMNAESGKNSTLFYIIDAIYLYLILSQQRLIEL